MSDDTPNNAPLLVAIVLDTHSTDPDFNGDCDYAVVRLTPELVDQVRRRVELARQAGRQDDDLYELYFWGGTAEFYDSGLVDACEKALTAEQAAQDWLAGLEQDGHALVPPAADLATCEPQRTECDQMIVRCSPSSHDPGTRSPGSPSRSTRTCTSRRETCRWRRWRATRAFPPRPSH